jgi:hypothetical protein
LSAKRSDLATDVAPFVKALKNAENQEARKQFGSGLAWFLSARQIYPQSEFASDGIKRLIDRILPEEEGAAFDARAGYGRRRQRRWPCGSSLGFALRNRGRRHSVGVSPQTLR